MLGIFISAFLTADLTLAALVVVVVVVVVAAAAAAAFSCLAGSRFWEPNKEVLISPLPFFHIYGFMASLNITLYEGGSMVTMPAFDMGVFLKACQECVCRNQETRMACVAMACTVSGDRVAEGSLTSWCACACSVCLPPVPGSACLCCTLRHCAFSALGARSATPAWCSYKCTRAHLVPPIILGLAKHPVVDKFDLSSLKTIISGNTRII